MPVERSRTKHTGCFTVCAVAVSMLLPSSISLAQQRVQMPLGALVCRGIETSVEHAKIVRQPSTAGLREFVQGQVESGACHIIKTEVSVEVIDVDQRGFALVQQEGQQSQGWTDAENLWGYFDTPGKLKAWKRP